MLRRNFLKVGAASIAGAFASTFAVATSGLAANDAPTKFKLKYAPHFGMFENSAGKSLTDQLRFAAGQGFTAWEDNGMRGRAVETQRDIAKTMEELGMTMGVFSALGDFNQVNFAGNDKAARDAVLSNVRECVDVAKRLNVKWMTVVPGLRDQRLDSDYQTTNCIELLKRCCEILEPHGLIMVLEPLNWLRNHPGVFLRTVPQAYLICRSVGSPSCKILNDLYHQQVDVGNLIPNIDRAWDEIAYFQVGDNPGRNEPGTGEINYRNVFHHIHSKGFDGVVGMEHGKSQPGKKGERALIEAYRAADSF